MNLNFTHVFELEVNDVEYLVILEVAEVNSAGGAEVMIHWSAKAKTMAVGPKVRLFIDRDTVVNDPAMLRVLIFDTYRSVLNKVFYTDTKRKQADHHENEFRRLRNELNEQSKLTEHYSNDMKKVLLEEGIL